MGESQSSGNTAEVYRVQPRAGAEQLDSNEDSARTSEVNADLPSGCRSWQAAVIEVPACGAKYPLTSRKSVVVLGAGRSGQVKLKEWDKTFVFDAETVKWREDSPLP